MDDDVIEELIEVLCKIFSLSKLPVEKINKSIANVIVNCYISMQIQPNR